MKTNSLLSKLNHRSLTKSEYFHFWGLILAISIGSEPNRRNYWVEESETDSKQLFPPHSFGSRFGMGIKRFEDILRCMTFGDSDPNDRWSFIRPLLTAINKRRQQFVVPSHILTDDELMSSWISRMQDYTSDAIPHLTKMIRKPKGVGTVMKCLADGVVGIMLQLEICEGKEAEAQKKWSLLPAGTAQTLRLSDPWHGSGRIIVADSAFSSVTTAIECRKKGLFYSGIVKTASREFPKDYLDDPSKYAGRGNHMTLTTTIENCKLIALGWKDKTIKKFISTCGTTQPGKPHQRYHYTRDGDVIVSEVPRPQLVSQYFDAASKIDVHNHLRQGLLNIEDAWGTQTWWHRLAATFIGVIVTDVLISLFNPHRIIHMGLRREGVRKGKRE